MIQGIPKISVSVICYNQEKVITRAIDSLLTQKDYIYEICVSDDCSNDKTWEILQEYSANHPGLFVLNRNEPNVGIFENIEKSWQMPSGDVIYRLAGDDECGEGWLKKVVDFIIENHIDIQNDAFTIYGDYKAIYPNGDYYIKRNAAINSGISPLRLSYRGIIGNRSACLSKNVLKQYKKVSKGRSYIAESAIDRQLQMFTKDSYYIPHIGNIYYANIGVSGNMAKKDCVERREVEEYAMKVAEEAGITVCKKDLCYADYRIKFYTFHQYRSIKNFLKMIMPYIKSLDWSLGKYNFNIKRLWFAMRKRLPHRKPIKMYV